jgi:hypothetical protein
MYSGWRTNSLVRLVKLKPPVRVVNCLDLQRFSSWGAKPSCFSNGRRYSRYGSQMKERALSILEPKRLYVHDVVLVNLGFIIAWDKLYSFTSHPLCWLRRLKSPFNSKLVTYVRPYLGKIMDVYNLYTAEFHGLPRLVLKGIALDKHTTDVLKNELHTTEELSQRNSEAKRGCNLQSICTINMHCVSNTNNTTENENFTCFRNTHSCRLTNWCPQNILCKAYWKTWLVQHHINTYVMADSMSFLFSRTRATVKLVLSNIRKHTTN